MNKFLSAAVLVFFIGYMLMIQIALQERDSPPRNPIWKINHQKE